ncbi:MAG: hypothetical protein U0798_13180 [Gemmataceae bacterium]
MIVVSDTSPLIVLAKLGCLQLLSTLYGTVFIPPEVERELTAKGAFQGVPDVMEQSRNWLQVHKPLSIETIRGIHPGEMAAIALSLELKARVLLIDDEKGRKAANERHISTIGTIGILETAAEIELIDLEDSFQQFKATNFRIAHSLLDQRLQIHQQKRKSS